MARSGQDEAKTGDVGRVAGCGCRGSRSPTDSKLGNVKFVIAGMCTYFCSARVGVPVTWLGVVVSSGENVAYFYRGTVCY